MTELGLDQAVEQRGRGQEEDGRQGDAGDLVAVADGEAGAPHDERIKGKERRERPLRIPLHGDAQEPHAVVVGQGVEQGAERAMEGLGPAPGRAGLEPPRGP